MTLDLQTEFVPLPTKRRLAARLLDKVKSLHERGTPALRHELGFYVCHWVCEMGSKGHYADSLFEQILRDLLAEHLIQPEGPGFIPMIRRQDVHVVDDS